MTDLFDSHSDETNVRVASDSRHSQPHLVVYHCLQNHQAHHPRGQHQHQTLHCYSEADLGVLDKSTEY